MTDGGEAPQHANAANITTNKPSPNGAAHPPASSFPRTRLPKSLNHAIDFTIKELTFFRVHLCAFTILPLIASAIFYASNGRFHVKFIDALFLCYSAMTVTGLVTINMSTVTVWQQVILYLLMAAGNVTTVSWLMVLGRKYFFQKRCEYIFNRRPLHRSRSAFIDWLSARKHLQSHPEYGDVDMVRKAQKLEIKVERPTPAATTLPATSSGNDYHAHFARDVANEASTSDDDQHVLSDVHTFTSSPRAHSTHLSPVPEETDVIAHGLQRSMSATSSHQHRVLFPQEGVPYPRRTIILPDSERRHPAIPDSSVNKKYRDFGGFPGPLELMSKASRRMVPNVHRKLERSVTVAPVQTLNANDRSWLNFDGLVVGRNSDFRTDELSDDELMKIGGQEYRALRILSYLIPLYFVGTQLLSYLIFGPWITATKTYDDIFAAQSRLVDKTWFSIFQVMSAYTGGGISLVDQSMIPFQKAYPMIFSLIFIILAGNHAMPIFLRVIIWTGSILAHRESTLHQTLSFLLEHPRRCFLYLFPSHQTWFLVITLAVLSLIEWVTFEVFDIGLPAYESIPVGVRIVAGLFQGVAARASGFSIVPVASFAPAIQFLYVIMMYIAVYPIAMSIRSTNVYEERSLGIYEESSTEETDEPGDLNQYEARERVGRYLAWHVRRQMTIDIWWLVWGILLVAIIERGNLMDDSKKWFDLFRVVFELVSAFGGIGFSLGVPYVSSNPCCTPFEIA
ncbi:hypothetical protein AX17_003073 [Amanita inopinata Kibby_2008]|nr:hypothetical protein AX17_003073 [Amanita inopinata Kibby_2008]